VFWGQAVDGSDYEHCSLSLPFYSQIIAQILLFCHIMENVYIYVRISVLVASDLKTRFFYILRLI
jgi:hypothetical protein